MSRKKKEEHVKLMSEFEYDCLWMSIRYSVGRHTIATHHHAADIAKNCYGRFQSLDRQQFTAFDINREIDSHLRFVCSFFIHEYTFNNRQELFRPLHAFFDFLNIYNIDSVDKLNKIKSINVDGYDADDDRYITNYTQREESDTSYQRAFSKSDINDLIIWHNLSQCLDTRVHKKAILIDDSEVEFFYGWTECYNDTNEFAYKKIMIPVDSFCQNAVVTQYITEDSVVKVEEMSSEIISDIV